MIYYCGHLIFSGGERFEILLHVSGQLRILLFSFYKILGIVKARILKSILVVILLDLQCDPPASNSYHPDSGNKAKTAGSNISELVAALFSHCGEYVGFALEEVSLRDRHGKDTVKSDK